MKIEILKTKYKLPELSAALQTQGISILFSPEDKDSAGNAADEIVSAQRHVHDFFGFCPRTQLYIFMYPNLNSMSRAFGRNLPDENCCFVPITGESSLIAFITPRANPASIRAILAHEYSHIAFAAFTRNHEIGDVCQRVPVWLDEGVALCIDRDFRPDFSSVEQRRLKTIREGVPDFWPDLSQQYKYFNRLDEGVEFGAKGLLAYAFSYFCVRKLIDRFGKRTLLDFLRDLADTDEIDNCFKRYFGFSVEDFSTEMKNVLSKS
jgi:hypothetical protein